MSSVIFDWKQTSHHISRIVVILMLTLGLVVLFLNQTSAIVAQENTTPVATVTLRATRSPTPCRPNNALFVSDVTVSDGQVLKQNEAFVKTWRVRNTGACAWDEGYSIRFWQGESNFGKGSAPLPVAQPEQDVEISLELVAPSQAGTYESVWGLFDATGQRFGTDLIVSIVVSSELAPPTSTPTQAVIQQSPTALPSKAPSTQIPVATEVSSEAPAEVPPEGAQPTAEVIPTPEVSSETPVEGSTPSPEGTPIAAEDSESAEETPAEGSQWSVMALMIGALLIVLLLLALMLILWQWRLRKRQNQGEEKSQNPKKNQKSATATTFHSHALSHSPPVGWDLDLESTAQLPVGEPEPPKGIPYLESLDCSTGTLYFALNQPLTRVGRGEDNELRIDQSFIGWQTVSRYHAKIERDGEELILVDSGSSNGSKVNGQYTKINLLQNDCTISFGSVKFTFRNQINN